MRRFLSVQQHRQAPEHPSGEGAMRPDRLASPLLAASGVFSRRRCYSYIG